jgi:dipeptidyl aminopeptidase/acylaminoacyl peptidase
VRLTRGKTLRRCPALLDSGSGARLLFCDGAQVKLLSLQGDLASLAASSGSESLPDLSDRFAETTPVGYGNYPAWSPDGSLFVYAKQKGEEAGHVIYDLYLRTRDGMERPLFTQPGYRVRTPVWSPDGRGVAFYAAKGEAGWGLFAADDVHSLRSRVQEVGAEVTTEESFEFVGPAWTSSGKGLLYFPRAGQVGGHYPFQWSPLGKAAGAGGQIEYSAELTTANDLAVSPQKNVVEAAFVATRRLAQDVYIMIATEPAEKQ